MTSVSYEVENYWKGFFAAATGALFVFLVTGEDFHFVTTDLNLQGFQRVELLAFAVMGVFGAVLGALFVRLQAAVFRLRKNPRFGLLTLKRPIFFDVLGLVVIVATALVTFPLGDYARQPLRDTFSDIVCNCSLTDAARVNANDWGNVDNVETTLLLQGLLIYVFAAFSTTLSIPAGLFLPVLISGGCWGRVVGELMAVWFPELIVTPAGYAIVGAAAMAAGVTRAVSTAVS